MRSMDRIPFFSTRSLLEDLAENAEYVNESLLRSIPLEQYEMDELWTVIKKKQKTIVRTGREESEEGDA